MKGTECVLRPPILQALRTLMQRQEVDFVYEYGTLPQPASTAVTVCSEGSSLLKDSVDVVLPLAPVQLLGAPPSYLQL